MVTSKCYSKEYICWNYNMEFDSDFSFFVCITADKQCNILEGRVG